MKKLLVVMALYNKEKYVERSINSILNQTYKDFSLVIVDDGSTDNSLEIAKKFLYDKRVSIITNEINIGCYYSKNVGLKFMESGNFDLYTIHDADDFSDSTRFKKIIKMFEEDKNLIAVKPTEMRIGKDIPEWCEPLWPSDAHAFFSKKVFDKLGYFDNFYCSSDSEYWARLEAFCKINTPYLFKLSHETLYYAEMVGDNMILKYDWEFRKPYWKKFKEEIQEMTLKNNFYRNFYNMEDAIK
jgi:glycosyltransferase involved in cell wall biosynthesis